MDACNNCNQVGKWLIVEAQQWTMTSINISLGTVCSIGFWVIVDVAGDLFSDAKKR